MKDITGKEYIYGIAQDKNGSPYLFNVGELVRCKDCRWREEEYCGFLRFFDGGGMFVKDNGYCSYGERREE